MSTFGLLYVRTCAERETVARRDSNATFVSTNPGCVAEDHLLIHVGDASFANIIATFETHKIISTDQVNPFTVWTFTTNRNTKGYCFSGGREFRFWPKDLRKHTDANGDPIYSFIFPKTMGQLRELEK